MNMTATKETYGKLEKLLFQSPMLASLRGVYGLFCASTTKRVHSVQFQSIQATEALVSELTAIEAREPVESKRVVAFYAALTRHAVIHVYDYELFVRALTETRVKTAFHAAAAEINWRTWSLVYLNTTGADGFKVVDVLSVAGVHFPEWFSSRRDNKVELCMAIERILMTADVHGIASTHTHYAILQYRHATPPPVCEVCNAATTKRCGKCMCVCYCSQQCQRAQFDVHKRECTELARIAEFIDKVTRTVARANELMATLQ